MSGMSKIPAGYKQTEVGVIPEDWESLELRYFSEKIMVGIASAATHAYRKTGIIMFRNQNILQGKLDDSEVLYIDPEYEATYKNKRLYQGDILTTRTGYPGITCEVPARYQGCQSFTTLITRLRQTRAFPAFVVAYINSAKGQEFFSRSQIGGAQKNVNVGTLRIMSIPLPPLPEQKRIAQVLGDVDALIQKLEALIAKKRDIKQASMQELLTGKRRLPGFSGPWETKKLGEVGQCLRGVSYKGDSDLSPHDLPSTKRLLRSNNIQNARVNTLDIQFVSRDRVGEHQIMKRGDILICMANGSKQLVGKAGYFFVDDGYDYTFGAFMSCFRAVPSEAMAEFVYYLFQTGRYRDYIGNLLAGSSINNLNPSAIESLEFSMPPLSEQTAIAQVLSDMDAELAQLESRLAKTRDMKAGLMQELLTGRIRLV